jgi:hypothetical protein
MDRDAPRYDNTFNLGPFLYSVSGAVEEVRQRIPQPGLLGGQARMVEMAGLEVVASK